MGLSDWFKAKGVTTAERSGPAWAALRSVIDPELGMDLVSLGMIREIALDGPHALVRMTLSTPGCPVGPQLVEAVAAALAEEGYEPEVVVEHDPPWSPDDIEPAARGRIRAG